LIKQPPQRYVYKINSTRLRKSKWNLNIDIQEAINKKELVSLAESTLIRFIDGLNRTNTQYIYNQIKSINKQLKQIKKLPTSIENRNNIKALYKNKYGLLMVKDYICIVVDNMKDFNRMNSKKGFFINGVRFKHLLGTPGGIKKYSVIYVSDSVHEVLELKINNGRDLIKEFIPSKLEAYKSLVCSASIPVSNPNSLLVVKDCETEFLSNIIKIDDTKSEYPEVTYEEDYPIKLNDSDGYGLISPELSKQWLKEIDDKGDYIPSGYCLRNSFCKGMVFTFDFHAFSDEIAYNYMVKDAWENDIDIRKVDLVLTTSMLKLWDSYKDVNHYLQCCKDNGYSFSITKHIPETLENERDLNYQFIQSLYMNDEGIIELIKSTIDEIKDVLDLDYRKSILFLKGIHLNELDFKSESNDFIKALMIDKRMLNDPFVKNKIHNMIKKRITEAKIGVLKTTANYSVVSGDPFSLCQSIFNMEITGLLKKGEFYSKYWNDKKIDKVACFRAPMTCHNNIRILNIKNYGDMQYWYQYMNTVTIFNSWDTTAYALNGLDKDADTVYTTNNRIILNSIRITDAIFCVQKSAKPIIPTKEDLIQSNKNGFGDEIGVTTNHITAMFDVLAKFEEDSLEYKTVMKRIMCGQNYQQNAIDKIKGIVSKSMPKEWHDYRSNIDDEFNKSIVANKKPYFFIYIYPQRKKQYNNFIKQTEATCLMRFGLTIEELIALENKTEEQEKYLKYYYNRMPVSINKSLMNKICWRVEQEFNNYNINKCEGIFDYKILMSDTQYSKGRYNAIKKLYQEYIEKIQQYSQLNNSKRIIQEDKQIHKQILTDDFKKRAYELCSNSDELCNIVLDICYKNNNSKQFAWDVCGDIFIDNLLRNNNYKYSYPVLDESGDIEFGGNKFSMIENILEDVNENSIK